MTKQMGIEGYLVLSVLAASPDREWYGGELATCVGASHGLVSRLLERLRERGWAVDRWEDNTPSGAGRQPRHYYRLEPAALPEVMDVLKNAGHRVMPLTRWASVSAAPNAAEARVREPNALSDEEIAASIASGVAELRRRAAVAAQTALEQVGEGQRLRDGATARAVPEPRAG